MTQAPRSKSVTKRCERQIKMHACFFCILLLRTPFRLSKPLQTLQRDITTTYPKRQWSLSDVPCLVTSWSTVLLYLHPNLPLRVIHMMQVIIFHGQPRRVRVSVASSAEALLQPSSSSRVSTLKQNVMSPDMTANASPVNVGQLTSLRQYVVVLLQE